MLRGLLRRSRQAWSCSPAIDSLGFCTPLLHLSHPHGTPRLTATSRLASSISSHYQSFDDDVTLHDEEQDRGSIEETSAARHSRGSRREGGGPVPGGALKARSVGFGKQPVNLPRSLQLAVDALIRQRPSRHLHHQVLRLSQALSTAGSPSPLDSTDLPPPSQPGIPTRAPPLSELDALRLGARGSFRRRGEADQTTWLTGEGMHVPYGKTQALAYMCSRMPSGYAAAARVFSEINLRIPTFSPSSMLDFGSGPLTAL